MLPDRAGSPIAAAAEAGRLLRRSDAGIAAALAEMDPDRAAGLVAAAATLEGKSRLLAAMRPPQRAAALERLSAPLVAALIQNLDENLDLLGDLSLAQFYRLLDLSDAPRSYGWIRAALSLDDARANALPLLVPTETLAEALLTRIEFQDHVAALTGFPIEKLRLPEDAARADPLRLLVDLFGEDLLREFPVPDPGLAAVLNALLEFDRERYLEVVRRAAERLEYAREHPDEAAALRTEPVLLRTLGAAGTEPEPTGAAGPGETTLARLREAILPGELVSALPRLLRALPPERRDEFAAGFQALALREAVAAGGSFAREDLEPVVRRVEALLLLGLAGAGPGREGELLQGVPARRIAEAGARSVERLRQVALRLRPLRAVLDADQQVLVEALCRPEVTLTARLEPALVLSAGDLEDEVPLLTLEEAHRRLEALAGWAALARVLTLRVVEAALAATGDVAALLASLALGALLYGRVELGLAEPADIRRFAARYLTPTGRTRRSARTAVERTAEAWAATHHLDPAAIRRLLLAGLDRLTAVAAANPSPAALREQVYFP